nr:sirohydrochlorin cobaltochelatase [Petralouisia muris]
MHMKQKQAILLVSFGTSYLKSKEKTIDKLLEKTAESFPDYRIYQAWTSKVIIKILKERNNIVIPAIEEAMAQIHSEGIEKLIVQPTHFINGIENETMEELVLQHAAPGLDIRFGDPLLTSTEDHKAVLQAVIREFSQLPREEALVYMGHGTTHHANSVYAALDYMLKDMGCLNFFMGTVEAYPDLDALIRQVTRTKARKVHLAPFMLVAGDHANNDMAGDHKDSWKSQFEAAGYEVECHLKGLGEYEGIRDIYMEHLRKAIEKSF